MLPAPILTQRTATIRAAVLVCLVSMMTIACSRNADVSSAIDDLIDDGKVQKIRLADATRFEWDQVYLFDPYTPRPRVCARLRIPEADCARRIPFESSDDGHMSIAFMQRGQLVQYVSHGRKNGDFTPVPVTQPLSPDTAVFRVVPSGGEASLYNVFNLVLE